MIQVAEVGELVGVGASAVTIVGALGAVGARWVKRRQDEVRAEFTARFSTAETQLKACLHGMSEKMDSLGHAVDNLQIEMKQVTIRSAQHLDEVEARMNGSYLRAKEFHAHATGITETLRSLRDDLREVRQTLLTRH